MEYKQFKLIKMGASKRTYDEVQENRTSQEKERDILNEIFHTFGQHIVYLAEENSKLKSNESENISKIRRENI